MVLIESKWKGNTLISQAVEIIDISPDAIVKAHTQRSYGKLMGIEYTDFQKDNNIIKCSFQQKFAFKNLDMHFVKKIDTYDDRVVVKFKTVNSMVDLRGKWSVTPTPFGSNIKLVQRTVVPGWARWLPGVEHLISGKITRIFEQMNDIR